ncbi:NUDIX domain-containing protein [Caproiciproducens galactitolivorans]|uniref:NUDIX hydrolase n=1 Tax=Caproiciproducens galactitolivorans TaxID=642589 RepID=A0ABT4BV41_9FIRM|nr:NUDIX hydrolase [Caproiciproducens galactitolivorans]MCY1714675.1 NUDIX hydrolase [Caproiciproducens galactitolivorans]
MEMNEKTLERKEIYTGRVLHFHVDKVELMNGRTSTRECVDHPGGASIAVLTEKNEMLFVRQFRYPYKEVVLEAPAGKLEKGEDPFEAIKREQREETGTTGKNYVNLGKLYPSPGYTNEIIYLYACRAQSFGDTDFDEDEFLEVEKIPMDEAVRMVMDGEIPDSKTQVLVLKTARLLQDGKI